MPTEEREVRMSGLKNREKQMDVDFWMKSFLKSMGTQEDTPATTLTPASISDFDSYLTKYVGNNTTLALLLDYDGTLSPIAPHPDLAILPSETKKVLERLSKRPDVFIAIVSGRGVEDVKQKVGIDNVTYAGNHGLEIHHSDGTKYIHPLPDSKIGELKDALEAEVCHHGSFVEDKGSLLTFHYRKVPVNMRNQMVDQAKELIHKFGFKIGLAHCALECKPKVDWNKGRASIYILRRAFGMDWTKLRILFAGDDVTDEDAIVALKGMAFSFRIVGNHLTKTDADRRLASTDSVLTLLKWVEKHMNTRK